jgi:ATP-dependent RNA helicase DHX57
MQLNLGLPPGPREYWKELANEHKNAPDHMKWMYDADPFAARRPVDERQAKRNAEPVAEKQGLSVSREYEHAPEVKMSTTLRDMVEEAVKQVNPLTSPHQGTLTKL